MSEYYLNTENINEWVENLVAGDRVLLSGTVYTARDAAHKVLLSAVSDLQHLQEWIAFLL